MAIQINRGCVLLSGLSRPARGCPLAVYSHSYADRPVDLFSAVPAPGICVPKSQGGPALLCTEYFAAAVGNLSFILMDVVL